MLVINKLAGVFFTPSVSPLQSPFAGMSQLFVLTVFYRQEKNLLPFLGSKLRHLVWKADVFVLPLFALPAMTCNLWRQGLFVMPSTSTTLFL